VAGRKQIDIDYSIIDNATDDQIKSFCRQYSNGDPEAVRAVELYTAAADAGDKSAARLLDRMEQIAKSENNAFYNAVQAGNPDAQKVLDRVIANYKSGDMTPGEQDFILKYGTPAESDIDLFLESTIGDAETVDKILESLTPKKVQAVLTAHELTEEDTGDLVYTKEELKTLRTGSDAEKAEVKAARRERAKHFLSRLTMLEFVTLLRNTAVKKQQEPIPEGEARSVNNYVMTKDVITKAAFGDPGIDGKIFSLVRETPAGVRLGWATGRGKTRKEVIVYTRLELNNEAMKAAGLTVKKNLSKCAREAFAAMLSHLLAGNKILSIGMIGELIFNTRSDNLTEAQRRYLKNGITEVFLTTQYLDTTIGDENYASLKESQGIEITDAGQLFPGHFTTVKINGNETDGIELFGLPLLYKLQNALERGQILRAPTEILKIPGKTDEDIVTIRAYLLRRIDGMKYSNLNRMIIYKNILDEVGIDPTDRAQRTRKTRLLNKVERILDYWKKESYIHDYAKLTRSGQPVKGTAPLYEIEIML